MNTTTNLGTNSKNYYELLNCASHHSIEQIRKEYQLLSLKYHPDKQRGSNEDQFKQINEAYNILKDEKMRKKYDQWLFSGLQIAWKDYVLLPEAMKVTHWSNFNKTLTIEDKNNNEYKINNINNNSNNDDLITKFRNYQL
ncbi:DnaJ-domain-containing protein [Neoconidiobolus thromboides FSU 785]|nr:DnaJ-domain-containing protein [Neoconidiobolus thromboides FSU 785]